MAGLRSWSKWQTTIKAFYKKLIFISESGVSLCCFQPIHHTVPGFDREMVIVPHRIYLKQRMMRLCAEGKKTQPCLYDTKVTLRSTLPLCGLLSVFFLYLLSEHLSKEGVGAWHETQMWWMLSPGPGKRKRSMVRSKAPFWESARAAACCCRGSLLIGNNSKIVASMCKALDTVIFVTAQLLQAKAPTASLRANVCIRRMLLILETNSFPLVCLLTVEICQFFDIVSQVSCHGQSLSHLQVGLSEGETREKVKKTQE